MSVREELHKQFEEEVPEGMVLSEARSQKARRNDQFIEWLVEKTISKSTVKQVIDEEIDKECKYRYPDCPIIKGEGESCSEECHEVEILRQLKKKLEVSDEN